MPEDTIDLDVLRAAAGQMRERAGDDGLPVLFLCVAAWLEAEASLHAGLAAANAGVVAATGDRWRIRLEGSTLPQAFAVARAYLDGHP